MIILLVCLTVCLMIAVACGVGMLLAQPQSESVDDHPFFVPRVGARPSDLRFRNPGRVRIGGFAPSLPDPIRVDRP
jgi:hypothetical protein